MLESLEHRCLFASLGFVVSHTTNLGSVVAAGGTLYGDDGNDTLRGTGNDDADSLDGGEGEDVIHPSE